MMFFGLDKGVHLNESVPVCYDGIIDFEKEAGCQVKAELLKIINQDRECDSFTAYEIGSDPKHHREKVEEKMIAESIERREKADREDRKERDRIDKEWREDQEKKASKRHFQQLLVMGFLMIVAQIFAGWLSRDKSAEVQTKPSPSQSTSDIPSSLPSPASESFP